MNDNILNRIVEEFYDTGRLVLNEFNTNTPEMTNLRNDYLSLTRYIKTGEGEEIEVDNLFDQWNNLTPTQQHFFENINKLEDFETKLDSLNRFKGISNKFNDYKDINFFREGIDVNLLYNLKNEIVSFSTADIEEFLPDNIIDIVVDKINKIEGTELKPHETSVTTERKRKEQIEQDNNSDLPLLSIDIPIDTEDKKNNLKTLQYILLNNFKTENGDFIDLEGMKSEINDGIFGEVTKTYVEFLQQAHPTLGDQNGIVNTAVWNIVLGLLFNREEKKLEGKEISDELVDILKFWNRRSNNTKERLNKNSSMRLFNNLVDFGIYKLEHDPEKRTDEKLKNKLENLVDTYKTIGGEIPELNKIEKDIIDIDDKITDFIEKNPKSFRKKIEELKKEKKKLEDKIKEYKKFKDIISQYRSGTPQSKEESLQKFIDIKKQSDERTIKGLFGKLKEVFNQSVENKDYSLDVINNLITRINDTLYVIHEKDILNNTKKNKSKKALKTIINSINLDKDIEEIISGLERINKRTYEHVLYELSFCECEDNEGFNYFRDCGSSLGNRSILLSAGNTPLKNLIDSTLTVSGCVESLYSEIIQGVGRSINKHDIISNKDINIGDITIYRGTPIEVKHENKTDFIFSEFFALYKNEPDRTNYYIPEKYNKYNDIINGLVGKLNSSDNGIIEEFDSTGGIFLKDYMFYPKGTYRLYWSDNSDRAQLPNEKRLTVRFEITGEGYQWVEGKGNCNLQQNESTDRLDEIIENFFDTGKFVI